jgi:hypothetical protein
MATIVLNELRSALDSSGVGRFYASGYKRWLQTRQSWNRGRTQRRGLNFVHVNKLVNFGKRGAEPWSNRLDLQHDDLNE